MENSINQKNDFLLTEILPFYKQLNVIYSNLLEGAILDYSNLCFVTDFYYKYKDTPKFEKAVLELILLTSKEPQLKIVTSLKKEIGKNIELYSNNKSFFDNIDALSVCDEFVCEHRKSIKLMEEKAYRILRELNSAKHELETQSWKGSQMLGVLNEDVSQMQAKYDSHCKELELQQRLKHEAIKSTVNYVDNKFADLYQLSKNSEYVLEISVPKEKVNNSLDKNEYLDYSLIEMIHDECNEIQFEDIPVIDLYLIFNNRQSSSIFKIINNERTRTYYLVYKLYNQIKQEKRIEWRRYILALIGVGEKTFNSICKKPKNEGGVESNKFVSNIDQLFDKYSESVTKAQNATKTKK